MADWDDFAEWAGEITEAKASIPSVERDLRPPVPRPSKVFGIGMNYRNHDHAQLAALNCARPVSKSRRQ